MIISIDRQNRWKSIRIEQFQSQFIVGNEFSFDGKGPPNFWKSSSIISCAKTKCGQNCFRLKWNVEIGHDKQILELRGDVLLNTAIGLAFAAARHLIVVFRLNPFIFLLWSFYKLLSAQAINSGLFVIDHVYWYHWLIKVTADIERVWYRHSQT